MVPLYSAYSEIDYRPGAARHAGNKADSISTFKGTLNFEAGVGVGSAFTD